MFLFSRIKNWLGYENLKSSDLNSEFNNLLTKAGSDTLSSANSTNNSTPTATSMQATNNPGAVGSENLAVTTQQDIQQLRFMISEIIGGAYWYSALPGSLTSINNSLSSIVYQPQSRIVSGAISATNQPAFLVPNGSALSATLKATATPLQLVFNGTVVTFVGDIAFTLGAGPSATSGFQVLVNDTNLSAQQASQMQGERGTQITIDTIGASIPNLTMCAWSTGSTEYFTAETDTGNNRLINAFRGVGFNSSGNWVARVALSDDQNIQQCGLAYIFATYNASVPGVTVTYNRPTVAFTAPSGASVGDFWYDITNLTWKTYNGSAFVATIACFVGITIQTATACVAARAADFYKTFQPLNTIEPEYYSTAVVRANHQGTRISVYGNQFNFDLTQPKWDTSVNLDTGLTLAASTQYFCYVKDTGNVVISNVFPANRKYDLFGSYHPANPWRCVGEFKTDGSKNIISGTVNYGIYAAGALNKGDLPPVLSTFADDIPISASSGSLVFNGTGSSTFTALTNLICSITCSGTRPVRIELLPDGSSNSYSITLPDTYSPSLQIQRDGSTIIGTYIMNQSGNANSRMGWNCVVIDPAPTAGVHTYQLYGAIDSGGTITIAYAKLFAYEI